VERLENDWAEVRRRLGFERACLPHANKTKRDGYRAYYTPETRAAVAERFRWVIDRFDYSF